MEINANTSNISASLNLKNTNLNTNNKEAKESPKNGGEAASVEINSNASLLNSDSITSEELASIKEQVEQKSKQLNVDFKQESANFDKNNINSLGGSLLSSQASNIDSSVFRLLSE